MSSSRRHVLRAGFAGAALSAMGVPIMGLAQGQKGGQIVIAAPQPRHFNPALMSGSPIMPGAQLFASPRMIDANWKPQPYLAERWSVAADGKSLTLNLRKGAVFHDGRPITSADLQFSIGVVKEGHPFRGMLESVTEVLTPDAHTVVVRTRDPHPALVLAMTLVFIPVLPKHIYGDGQPMLTHPRNTTNVVGSGPYKLIDFKSGEHVVMQRHENFFIKDQPLADRLIFRIFRDEISSLLAFERGEIDAIPFLNAPPDVARAAKVPGATVLKDYVPGVGPLVWLAFNLEHPILSKKPVRQAISYAIDRDFVVNRLPVGAVRRATGPIHSASPFYEGSVERYDLNLAKAAALLDQAGHRAAANGTRFALSCDCTNSGDQRVLAEYLKPALAKIGIDLTVRVAPDFPTWARRVSEYSYEMTTDSVWNWGDPAIGVHRTYLSSNIRKGVIWSNTHQYRNQRVDELLARAAITDDLPVRRRVYGEFQKIVVDDCPIAFVFETGFSGAYSRRIGNTQFGVWGPMSPLGHLVVRA